MAVKTRATVERKKNDTPKAKPQIAIELGMPLAELQAKSIIWVPFAVDQKTKYLLADVCEARNAGNKVGDGKRNLKSFALMAELAHAALDAKRAEFEIESKSILRKEAEEATEEQLTKQLLAMERRMAATRAALDAKRVVKPTK